MTKQEKKSLDEKSFIRCNTCQITFSEYKSNIEVHFHFFDKLLLDCPDCYKNKVDGTNYRIMRSQRKKIETLEKALEDAWTPYNRGNQEECSVCGLWRDKDEEEGSTKNGNK